ncbi:MAG: hypothetical protein JXQ90_23810 [Cyclobacteriaceae bacterium]
MNYDIVILTCDQYVSPTPETQYVQNLLLEDGLLQDHLEEFGLKVARKSWADPIFDWSKADFVIFRTTWDYHERLDEFIGWLGRASRLTKFINEFKLIQWNLDKHYLIDLKQKGIPVVPTRYVKPLSKTTLKSEMNVGGWENAVLKPAVSSTSRHTYRIQPHNIDNHESVFQRLIREECMMIQPFVSSIQSIGEVSLVVIGGMYSHAVLKRAKLGDFRVQDDFGGTVEAYEPTPGEIALAEKAVDALPYAAIYARVDIVYSDDNQLWITEVELLEPELFFRLKPEAAAQLSGIIHHHIFIKNSLNN